MKNAKRQTNTVEVWTGTGGPICFWPTASSASFSGQICSLAATNHTAFCVSAGIARVPQHENVSGHGIKHGF